METTGGGKCQFRLKKSPLRNEDIQIVCQAALVSQSGKMQGRPQGTDLPFLCGRLFTGCADPHQRVFNLPERNENCLFVLGHSLFGLGFYGPLLKPQRLGIQQGAGQYGGEDSETGCRRHKIRQVRTRHTENVP